MKIQSINSPMKTVGCQPIRQVEFSQKKVQDSKPNNDSQNQDKLTLSTSETLEQKYDLACRIAAYYKQKYQQLLKSGHCVA